MTTPTTRTIDRLASLLTPEAVRATGVFALLVAVAAGSRLLPHAPNFTALAAVTLFAGFHFRRTAVALAVPMVAMLASDLFIGAYSPALMAVVYGSIALSLVLRRLVGSGTSVVRLGLAATCSALSFFLITNFAVWALSSWYPRSGEGLLACYAAALPFLKYQLAGDLVYTGVVFGAYWAVKRLAANRRVVAAA